MNHRIQPLIRQLNTIWGPILYSTQMSWPLQVKSKPKAGQSVRKLKAQMDFTWFTWNILELIGKNRETSRLEDTNGVFNLGTKRDAFSLSGLIIQGARMGRREIHQTGWCGFSQCHGDSIPQSSMIGGMWLPFPNGWFVTLFYLRL